jgi:hypothetical protein
MASDIDVRPSRPQSQSWCDDSTLNILTKSTTLAIVVGVFLILYWDKLPTMTGL